MIIMPTRRRASRIAQIFAFLTLTGFANASFSQSHLSPPEGEGWQMLGAAASAAPAAAPVASLAMVAPSPSASSTSLARTPAATPAATPAVASTDVTPVVLPGASAPAGPHTLTLAITPQDINLRNALDRWLQQQGWQLAWKIDDDLPLEFNATFSGDFDSVLTQLMRATNHMRTPTRVCVHTNNVIRVVARAANCQD
ncbi:toxin co-regulated pilus biosynthesis Q family protein [Paraburkholderia sp. MMS20-SJTR3]|uniref:Toxin co-regulated pilus biosynthesis Q family protein n=1 Tax=Paraburkholderia sejongensis TaxID=2886946 RepID=A0ABS8K569_9BURK|nr:toxin co-regulated pilus biosynthesis Q family protein [Paraburkholderia sp. MMS20-SJTR3]MCC8397248.1 toxin co-regulated pilus biosynthesis Q family protein [Paraburkholderia sp. MMS20-SJTR3]